MPKINKDKEITDLLTKAQYNRGAPDFVKLELILEILCFFLHRELEKPIATTKKKSR